MQNFVDWHPISAQLVCSFFLLTICEIVYGNIYQGGKKLRPDIFKYFIADTGKAGCVVKKKYIYIYIYLRQIFTLKQELTNKS